MIDWLAFRAPLSWVEPINGGRLVRLRQDGSVDYVVDQSRALVSPEASWEVGSCNPNQTQARTRSSYASSLRVRSVELGMVEVSGNPAKWFQGHNLFGTDDVPGLFLATMERVASMVDVEPSDDDRAAWLRGDARISRVDCTTMLELDSLEEVMEWLRAADQVANVKWRGRGHYDPGTLTFGRSEKGKRAKDWQLVLYCKGKEISLPGHELNPELPMASELWEWAQNKLRIELRLRSAELKRLGLLTVGDWKDPEQAALLRGRYFSKVEMSEQQMMHISREGDLKPSEMNALAAWRAGADPKSYMKHSTFFRCRKSIMETVGIDIGARVNVTPFVPLVRALEARPATVPAWAQDLQFNPPRRFALAA